MQSYDAELLKHLSKLELITNLGDYLFLILDKFYSRTEFVCIAQRCTPRTQHRVSCILVSVNSVNKLIEFLKTQNNATQ